jgi:phage gp29-like protein
MRNNRPEYLTIADIKAGRDITRGWVGRIGGLLPTQDAILQLKSGGDLKLYEEVAQDDQIQSCMQQRISAITSSDWEIVPGGDKRADLKAAEFVETQIRNLNWDDTISKMLWGRFYGYSVAELIWAVEADQVSLSDIRVRNRRRFRFDVDQQPRLITYSSPQGEALPDQKFWTFACGADHHDEPYGRGLAYWLYWLTYFKRQDMRWWMHFLEKFAKPTRRGLYPPSATEAEQETLWQAMTGFGSDDQLMVPEGMMVDFLEAQRSGTADYQAMLDHCNSAIAKVILSQTMTTDNGSSMAQANVHAGVKEEVVRADADLICGSFNGQVLPWLMGYNPQFGKAALPKLWYRLESEPDLKSQVERDKILFDMGFVPNSDYIRQTYGDGFVLPEAEQTALNGTQLQSMLDIVDAIQSGTLSVDAGQALIGLAVPTIDPEIAARIAQPPAQEPTEPVDPATLPSLDDVAATFAAPRRRGRRGGRGKKNCEKGLNCGGSCISKKKTCVKDMTPEQKALHKKAKKAAGGGGATEETPRVVDAPPERPVEQAPAPDVFSMTAEELDAEIERMRADYTAQRQAARDSARPISELSDDELRAILEEGFENIQPDYTPEIAKAMGDRIAAGELPRPKRKGAEKYDFEEDLSVGGDGDFVRIAATSVLSEGMNDIEVSFKVNGTYDVGSISDRRLAYRAARTAEREFKDKFKLMPDGQILVNLPYDGDGNGGARRRIYERAGFGSDPSGQSSMMYAVIKDGKPVPLNGYAEAKAYFDSKAKPKKRRSET